MLIFCKWVIEYSTTRFSPKKRVDKTILNLYLSSHAPRKEVPKKVNTPSLPIYKKLNELFFSSNYNKHVLIFR